MRPTTGLTTCRLYTIVAGVSVLALLAPGASRLLSQGQSIALTPIGTYHTRIFDRGASEPTRHVVVELIGRPIASFSAARRAR